LTAWRRGTFDFWVKNRLLTKKDNIEVFKNLVKALKNTDFRLLILFNVQPSLSFSFGVFFSENALN